MPSTESLVQGYCPAVVPWYGPGVVKRARLILAALLFAQLADAITFYIGVQVLGIGAEANGWARMAYEAGGLPAVMGIKTAAILIVLGVLVATAQRYPRLLVMGGATATSIGLLGAVVNTLSIAVAHG